MSERPSRLLFVTGLAGSGKSLCGNVLEDLGYYVLDNLPAGLIAKFVELLEQSGEEIPRAALVVDIRDRTLPDKLAPVLAELRSRGHGVRVLYLESSDDVLLRRFSETRRIHPLAAGLTTSAAMGRERELMAPVRLLADKVLDTSAFDLHSLRRAVVDWVKDGSEEHATVRLTLLSFGFKFGLPADADWVFDARFLPNPFFVPGLRELSGRDAAVQSYVRSSGGAAPFVSKVCDILRAVIPEYVREGRTHLTVAIGCTGGRHRSVAVARDVAAGLDGGGTPLVVTTVDRDIDKG